MNGITLLCNEIAPIPGKTINKDTGSFNCKGIQVINGAQTVVSLGNAFGHLFRATPAVLQIHHLLKRLNIDIKKLKPQTDTSGDHLHPTSYQSLQIFKHLVRVFNPRGYKNLIV